MGSGMKAPSPKRSARRSIMGLEVGSSIDSHSTSKYDPTTTPKDNRPPAYVPSKRDPNAGRVGLRDSLNSGLGGQAAGSGEGGYKPKTSFSYVPSAELQQQQKQSSLFGRQNSRGSSGSRYQPSQAAAGNPPMSNPSSGLGMMGMRRSSRDGSAADMLPISSPNVMKPPISSAASGMPPKPKPAAAMPPPAVATFAVKTTEYAEDKKNKRPDILM